MEYKYDISVVVPLYNEDESLPELYAWIERVMNAHGFTYEIIFVNDGSTDRSWEVIEGLAAKNEHVHGIKSAETMENLRPCSVDSVRHRDVLSLRWMPTCRIHPTKSPSCTA